MDSALQVHYVIMGKPAIEVASDGYGGCCFVSKDITFGKNACDIHDPAKWAKKPISLCMECIEELEAS